MDCAHCCFIMRREVTLFGIERVSGISCRQRAMRTESWQVGKKTHFSSAHFVTAFFERAHTDSHVSGFDSTQLLCFLQKGWGGEHCG